MRRARIPHARAAVRGSRQPSCTGGLRLRLRSRCLAAVALVLAVAVARRSARPGPEPSLSGSARARKSSFPKHAGRHVRDPAPKIDQAAAAVPAGRSADLRHQGQPGDRAGNVEIYYNNYILTADQVIYDQSANTLTAEGNVQLKEPNGNIIRADRFEALRRFPRRLHPVAERRHQDDTRIAAERATRREGNVTEFEQRQVHALQERPRHAAAVVHRRRAHHPRSAGGDHHLPGRAVRAVRRAGPLPALLPARRSVGEAHAPAS